MLSCHAQLNLVAAKASPLTKRVRIIDGIVDQDEVRQVFGVQKLAPAKAGGGGRGAAYSAVLH
jgi:hypothetical protein